MSIIKSSLSALLQQMYLCVVTERLPEGFLKSNEKKWSFNLSEVVHEGSICIPNHTLYFHLYRDIHILKRQDVCNYVSLEI
jgi:hypothetical protein